MQHQRLYRVIGTLFFGLVLMVAVKVAAIVTAVPEPPLPPLLQGLEGVGGSTTVCPPATEQEAALRHQISVGSPMAWSPEFGRRIKHEFPPGSEARQMTEQLQKLGFRMLGSCKGDPSIQHAFFEQHGGFPLRSSGIPMVANVWWQVDSGVR
jgi:hypothetical protein